jgi:NodT family efflux transporter outer membrane factor (OMF) lipoprotein
MTNLKRTGQRWLAPSLIIAACGALVSCAVGPNYKRPDLAVPSGYKEPATPSTGLPAIGSDWWTLFNDPALTKLAQETMAANLDIKAAIARVDQAHDVTLSAMGSFFPAITSSSTARRTGGAAGTSGTTYTLPVSLNYEVDLWGHLRRQYESSKNSEQATADDLEFARQTAVANLAQAYFNIRLFDQQIAAFEEALVLYNKQLDLTETKFKAGLALPTDRLQAINQVDDATNQLIEVKRSRAKQEHAIAILLGRPPSDLSLEHAPLTTQIPVVPTSLPITLLSRRPDVASAEHRLAAANAQVGVAVANFFPTFSLNNTSLSFVSNNLNNLVEWERRTWSEGAGLSLSIFQGGQQSAALAQAKARYQELVATYRSAVLGAFRDIEDQLSDLQLLADKTQSLEKTLANARENARLTEIQYQQGLTTYLQVITTNQTLLTNELSAAQAQSQRLSATVLLIKALGGGWPGETSPARKS